MKTRLMAGVALALLCAAVPAGAAQKTLTVEAVTRIVDGRREWHESRSYTYTFEVEVISDREGPKPEGRRWGRPFVTAWPGEEYRVRIHNPLPVPVAANLSIDGLNSITGEPGSPSAGSKWVIEPFSWVDIAGWQISGRESRRFYFTSREGSYSAWRSNDWGRDLSVNAGVIGVAYFWSQRALEDYFHHNPVVIRRRDAPPGWRGKGGYGAPAPESGARSGEMPEERAEQQAGTGMGRRQSNPVREVRFAYDRGMYEVRDALIVYYDFAEDEPRPRPFEDGGRYAPESPVAPQPPGWRPIWPPLRRY